MIKALVTGSRGFLGSHLCQALLSRKWEVIPLPRDLLLQKDKLREFCKTNFDYIFHLATYGNMSTQKDEQEVVTTNYVGTWNLLQVTVDTPYKAFVNMSTSSVDLPVQTFYSSSKMGSEYLCKAYTSTYNKPIVSIRPSSITGPGEQLAHLIPTLINSAKEQQRIPFVPYPTHDFIDVRDVVDALLFVVDNIQETKGHTYKVSSGKTYTNKQVLEKVEKLTEQFINAEYVESMRDYDTSNWTVDNSELVMLGWEPELSLEDSIRDMI